jgi:predicted metalloendopeptidase
VQLGEVSRIAAADESNAAINPVNPNPNAEPMAVMQEKLARLNMQAEHLTSKTKNAINDFRKVASGKATTEQMKRKYANQEAVIAEIAAAMDPTADRCQDLYKWSCGSWINTTANGTARYSFSKTFSVIARRNRQIQREILTNVPTEVWLAEVYNLSTPAAPGIKKADDKYQPTGLTQKQVDTFRHYYQACMDTKGRNERGMNDATFQLLLSEVSGATSKDALLRVLAQKEMAGLAIAPMQLGIGPDDMDKDTYTLYVQQPRLPLPDNAIYYSKINIFEQVRQLYKTMIQRLFVLTGYSGSADNVLNFETRMALASRSDEELQDPTLSYNPTTTAEFVQKFPALRPYMDSVAEEYPALGGPATIIDTTPDYFATLQEMLSDSGNMTVSLAEVKDTAVWALIHSTAPMLGDDAIETLFAFFGTALQGATERTPTEESCMSDTIKELWGYTDKMFVERTFGKDAQVQMEIMVNTIKEEFKIKLEKNEWMDATTKTGALQKLDEMTYKIGAPAKWPEYAFTIGSEYLQNKLTLWKDRSQKSIKKYGGKSDNTEWGMSPSEVNAYYSPGKNEMVFPAGILQPPFFNPDQPMVINYASIGSIMGHELTHGFDDVGSQFDKYGEYRDWWSPETKDTYQGKTSCFVDQYFNLSLPELNGTGQGVDGNLTLGENIADNGGAKISRNAYLRYASQYGAATAFKVGDFQMTADEMFWLGWGQTWCKVQSKAALLQQVSSDEHAPAKARVNGVAMNSLSYAEATGCQTGTPMNPESKCDLW